MQIPGNWSDPSLWIGAGGGFAAIVAILKTVVDWRRDRGGQRQSAEDQMRGNLLEQNVELRHEIAALREELAEARREMNKIARDAERRLRDCEARAVGFQRQLTSVQAELQILRGQHSA